MKTNKKQRKNTEGITLIALVITIIVLLILAGVSIAMLTGQNGILTQAQRAKNETENAQANEQNTLANYESYLNSYSGENTEFTDSLGNKVIVPAGFRVVNPGDNVEDGIIIEDVTHGATAGSQFVWIPVGTGIKKRDGTTFNITLERYEFNRETGQLEEYTASCKEETLSEHTYDNIPAKDIEAFILKVNNETHGYYIGRYEARTATKRTTKTDALTQITVKPDDYVYNYVTQLQAAELSRNMYNDTNFVSDLINSYAWDTAIEFLQKCDNRENKEKAYSIQTSLNRDLAPKGTNNEEIQDIICNIFDMASNCYEWSTETGRNTENKPCVCRGGRYTSDTHYTGTRSDIEKTNSYYDSCFRPILYF